jgi:hypothetical protein
VRVSTILDQGQLGAVEHPSETHWQLELHTLFPQWHGIWSPGLHAAPAGHEHAPQVQLDEHVNVPYVLHGSDSLGEHAPWPKHAPMAQDPWVQVSVSLPQLPHAAGSARICPETHSEHAPPLHTPPLHVVASIRSVHMLVLTAGWQL